MSVYLEVMPAKPIELPLKVAKTFVKHMGAFYSERCAIKRDKMAGDAARLLKPYLPPRDRKLRLPDIYEMFEAMKDHLQEAATITALAELDHVAFVVALPVELIDVRLAETSRFAKGKSCV